MGEQGASKQTSKQASRASRASLKGRKRAAPYSLTSAKGPGPPRSADPCALGLSSALDHSFEVRLHAASTRLQHIHSRSCRPPIVVGCVQLIHFTAACPLSQSWRFQIRKISLLFCVQVLLTRLPSSGLCPSCFGASESAGSRMKKCGKRGKKISHRQF